MRVASSVWWPGVTQVCQEVEQYKECAKEDPKKKESLIITSLPDYHQQMVVVDLFEMNKDYFLLIAVFSNIRKRSDYSYLNNL